MHWDATEQVVYTVYTLYKDCAAFWCGVLFSHVSYWYCRMHFDWARCKAAPAVLFSECTVSGVCVQYQITNAAYNVLAVCHFMAVLLFPNKRTLHLDCLT